jgi:hypothetical protein
MNWRRKLKKRFLSKVKRECDIYRVIFNFDKCKQELVTIWSVFLFFFFGCWLLLYRETGDKLANDETISDETDENICETTLTRCERCRRGKRMAVLLPGIDGPVIISRSGSGLWSFVFHNVTFWICLHIYLSMNWNIKNCNKRRSYRDCYRRWLHFV